MDEKHTRKDLIKVAKLYYYGNLSQSEIAQSMGISRPKVSRMLTQARSQNIIEFKIKDFPMMVEEMAKKIQTHFKLAKVIIAPSGITPEQSKCNAGNEASEFLNSTLRSGMQIGLSWGTTLQSVIRQFEIKKRFDGIHVVQLAGGVHSRNIDLDSQRMVRSLAEKLGASYSILQAPLVVTSGTVRNLLLEEPEIKNHCEQFNHLDVALIGVGSMAPEEAIPYKAGYITLEQSHILVDTGFATDICGNRIFLDGTVRTNLLSDKLICISPEQIKLVPTVIAIAVGAGKAIPVIAAAKGGFFNVLIIDEVAAITILGIENLS